MLIEVACFNKIDALTAYELGANRIELCSNYSVGGLSPSIYDVEFVLQNVGIPVTVMLRPSDGSFSYSKKEELKMLHFLAELKRMPVNGIVFGVDYGDNWMNIMKNWLDQIEPLKITFHRAIEQFPNPLETIHELNNLGIQRVLTGGSALGVMHHLAELIHLLDHAPHEMEIILGGGIRAKDVSTLRKFAQIKWIHTACFNKTANQLDQQELKKLIKLSSVEAE